LSDFQAQSIVTWDFSEFHDKLLDEDVVNSDLINVEYSDYAASILSYMSAWCYSNQEDFKGMMARSGIKGVECIEVSRLNDVLFISAKADVIRSDDGRLAIVCFRGTELTNATSWLTDVCAAPAVLYPDKIQVHGGFVRNFQSIWPEVVQALCCKIEKDDDGNFLKFCHDDEDKLDALYICGHSLGGAMATLAALSLRYVDNNPVMKKLLKKLKGVYTYGQPMLLSLSGKSEKKYVPTLDTFAEKAVYRHVFGKDPVPHLPPTETGPWCHVGLELRWEQGQWVPHKKPEYSAQAKSLAVVKSVAPILTDQLDPSHAMRMICSTFKYNFYHHSPWNYTDTLPPAKVEVVPSPSLGLAERLANVLGLAYMTNAISAQVTNVLRPAVKEALVSATATHENPQSGGEKSGGENETEDHKEGSVSDPNGYNRNLIYLVIFMMFVYLWWSK
jgi:hypothetical protein